MKEEYLRLIENNVKYLNEDHVYRYVEICSRLGLPYKKTDTHFKDAIFEQLSKYITYEQNGRSYLILSNTNQQEGVIPPDVASKKNSNKKEDEEDLEKDAIEITEFHNLIKEKIKLDTPYTYKELCYLTGYEYGKGNTRTSFYNKLERCTEFKRERRKIIINKIRKLPILAKTKLRKDAIYTRYITCILMNYLYDSRNHGVMIAHPQAMWWFLLGITNIKYKRFRNKSYKELIEMAANNNINLTKEAIEYYYYTSGMKFSKIFNEALKDLDRRRLILYKTVYVGIDEDDQRIIINSKHEEKTLLGIENQALRECGLHSMSQIVYDPSVRKKYYKVLERITAEKTIWKRFYRNTGIIYNHDHIQRELGRDENELKAMIYEFNDKIYNYLKTNAIQSIEKELGNDRSGIEETIDLLGDGVEFSKYEITKAEIRRMNVLTTDYIDQVLFLNDELIKLDKDFTPYENVFYDEKDYNSGMYKSFDNMYDYLPIDINFE